MIKCWGEADKWLNGADQSPETDPRFYETVIEQMWHITSQGKPEFVEYSVLT